MPVAKGTTKARTPTQIKRMRGTDRGTVEAVHPDRLPDPPAYLNPGQRGIWAQFAAVLNPLRVATAQDFASFEMLVCLYWDWLALRARLRAIESNATATFMAAKEKGDTKAAEACAKAGSEFDPYVYETFNAAGGVMYRLRPEVSAVADMERRLMPLLGRFGLSPADRSRVTGGGGDGAGDPDEEFRQGAVPP